MRFVIKIIITAIIVALVAEAGKRTIIVAAILASLPITSILSIIWLYGDTSNLDQTAELARSIFWSVLPSLVFFVAYPQFVKFGFHFKASLFYSTLITAGAYLIYAQIQLKWGS